MIVVRILVNALVLFLELGLVFAVAWLAWHYPVPFAAATGCIALLLGLALERSRLTHELPYYMEAGHRPRTVFIAAVAGGEAAVKGLLAGVAALLTFSGTDAGRLGYVAIVFGICVFLGTSVLRRLSLSLGAVQSRWGFFRLAPLLGIAFSAGIAGVAQFGFIPRTTLSDLTRRVLWDTPERPSLEQASELLFQFKQYFDAVVQSLLRIVVPPDAAQAVGVFLSVNMLTGFVAAVYAVLIAEIVRHLERR